MRYFLLLIILLFFSCQTHTTYPEGGFDYPKNVLNSDTNLYNYPLKDIESRNEAFRDTYAYLFYQPFNEPNLSIKPQSKEIFRLTYSTVFGSSVIINLTEEQIIVKKGRPSSIYDDDISRLTNTEKFHLNLLRRRFPIDTAGKKPFVKHYLDSLTKLYPQLLDPTYYHKLYEKTIFRNGEQFIYQEIKINLTKHQHDLLVHQINASGFWTMNYKVDCKDPANDAGGFILEANTKKKYKFVYVEACDDDTTKFTKACQKLIEFAKLSKEINLVRKSKIESVDTIELPDIKK